MKTLILTLALFLGLAGVALAADEVLLNDGDVVTGTIEKVDQTGISVKTDGGTIVVAPESLDAHYYYEQWKKHIDKDAEQYLRLAVYAYENGMFNQARSMYRKAQRLDKELVKKFETEIVPQIKEGVAEQLLGKVRAAIDKKDWHTAERIAAKILTQLEDTKAAEQAREALASVHLWQLNADQERLTKALARFLPRDAEKALKEQARIVQKLEPQQRKIDKARENITKGLRTKSANRQKGIFEKAAKDLENVVKSLDKLTADAGGDEALKAHIGGMRSIAVREAVEAYIHAGNVYMVRGSFNEATAVANAALALDPGNQQAQQFLNKVVMGAQMRSGWWGGRRR